MDSNNIQVFPRFIIAWGVPLGFAFISHTPQGSLLAVTFFGLLFSYLFLRGATHLCGGVINTVLVAAGLIGITIIGSGLRSADPQVDGMALVAIGVLIISFTTLLVALKQEHRTILDLGGKRPGLQN